MEINDRLLAGYVGLAVAQYELGDVAEANASLDMALGAEPNSTLLFSEMARLQLKMGAARESKRYVGSSETHPSSRRGADLAVDDLVARQIDRHREAIRQRPNHADLHYRLGLLLRHCNETEEAIQCFRQAVAINPTYVKALIKLGLCLKESGQIEAAVEPLRRAAELDPHDADLHYALGLIFADQRKFSLAVEQFETALSRDPKNIDFHANLALALQNMGLVDRAAASWQTLCDMLPETAAGRTLLRQATQSEEE